MVWEYETQGTTTALAGGEAMSPIAITRTGSSARPSSAARTSRPSRSCEVEGATSTTGSEPSTGETSGPGGSHISGPTIRTHGSQSRGYSSCGSAPTSVSERDNPVWTDGNGPSPRRARVSLYSCRPCSSPRATTRSVDRQSAVPNAVRGSRAPIENGGNPGGTIGNRCGTNVATGTSHSSAARAGATVSTSETATSGANARTKGTVSCAARTAASYGFSGRSRVGNTWYSGAAENVMPASTAASDHFLHVWIATWCPASTRADPSASIGNACPGSPNAPRRTFIAPSRTPRPRRRPSRATCGARRVPTRATRTTAPQAPRPASTGSPGDTRAPASRPRPVPACAARARAASAT